MFMDTMHYLRRLGLDHVPSLTRAGLDQLIYAHQHAVPFENLTLCDQHECADINPEILREKIVEMNRGGYCFELNGALCCLLQELGFDAWSVFVRVAEGGVNPAINHRGVLVRIDGVVHYVDVGKGDLKPAASIPLDGRIHSVENEMYCMVPDQDDDEWAWLMTVQEKTGEYTPCLRFNWTPRSIVEFEPYNQDMFTNPISVFPRKRLLTIRTEKGFRFIRGDVYTDEEFGVAIETISLDDQNYSRIIEEKFNVKLEGWK